MSCRFVKEITTSTDHPMTTSSTPAEVLYSGNGDTEASIPFKSNDGAVISGIWASEAFSKKKAHPDEMEFCYLIEGVVKLTDTDGNSSTFSAGQSFVVEPGFDGIWESLTTVRKYFVIAKCR